VSCARGAAQARLEREWARLSAVRRDVRALVAARRALLRADDPADPTLPMVRRLLALRAIGEVGAWIYTTEFFAWRQFRNRRQVGAAAGLCSTRRDSGAMQREQGISKAGNRYLRSLAIELAWSWLRRQPQSALSQWYRRRYAAGGPRLRRIGIVAGTETRGGGATSSKGVSKEALPRRVYGRVLPFSKVKCPLAGAFARAASQPLSRLPPPP
jgi:hypothetical protein